MTEYETVTLEISRAGLEISRWHMIISAVGTILSSCLIAWGLWLMTKASRNRSREIDELAKTFRQQNEAQIEVLRQQGEGQVEALRQQTAALAELLRRTA